MSPAARGSEGRHHEDLSFVSRESSHGGLARGCGPLTYILERCGVTLDEGLATVTSRRQKRDRRTCHGKGVISVS